MCLTIAGMNNAVIAGMNNVVSDGGSDDEPCEGNADLGLLQKQWARMLQHEVHRGALHGTGWARCSITTRRQLPCHARHGMAPMLQQQRSVTKGPAKATCPPPVITPWALAGFERSATEGCDTETRQTTAHSEGLTMLVMSGVRPTIWIGSVSPGVTASGLHC